VPQFVEEVAVGVAAGGLSAGDHGARSPAVSPTAHIGAGHPVVPPAGDNSEFGVGPTPGVATGVDTCVAKSVDTGPSKFAKDLRACRWFAAGGIPGAS
jgi:hypothetical protein